MRYQSARDLLIDLKHLRRDLDIKGEIERSIVPTREPATAAITENETRTFAPGATRSGNAQSTKSSSSLEYALNQAKSHKIATAIVSLFVLAIGAIGLTLYVRARATDVAIDSIAVLPFQNRTGDADTEYLSDGLAESLIYRLSQLPVQSFTTKVRKSIPSKSVRNWV
jgi:hypothetical protein